MITRRADLRETLDAIRPQLAKLRGGDWRLMVIGPATSRERDAAAVLSARLLDLVDAVEGSAE